MPLLMSLEVVSKIQLAELLECTNVQRVKPTVKELETDRCWHRETIEIMREVVA
jgi:hypothetical protein